MGLLRANDKPMLQIGVVTFVASRMGFSFFIFVLCKNQAADTTMEIAGCIKCIVQGAIIFNLTFLRIPSCKFNLALPVA